jgi:hypothetical protein
LVKQYLKNRRGNHYANGWLDVPAKYNYLKGNSAKRNPTGSRKKKGLSAAAAQKKARNRSDARGRLARVKARGRDMIVDGGGESDGEHTNEDEPECENE